MCSFKDHICYYGDDITFNQQFQYSSHLVLTNIAFAIYTWPLLVRGGLL